MTHAWHTLAFEEPGAWRHAGSGGFTPAGAGEVETRGGTGLLWYARADFADVELEVEWRLSAREDNSGVYLRFPDAELARSAPDWKAGLEVQIDERGVDVDAGREGSALHRTGALYGHAPATALASRPVGEWNRFRIVLRGERLAVWLNDVAVCEARVPAGTPARGRLGLQNHHDGSRVRFRPPRVRTL